jgi:hypothetical protein
MSKRYIFVQICQIDNLENFPKLMMVDDTRVALVAYKLKIILGVHLNLSSKLALKSRL